MASRPKHRLLLLDPDKAFLADLSAQLAEEYEICALTKGSEAVDRLDRYTPDVIVLEAALADMDAMKFARLVHRNPRHKDVPLVFLSEKDSNVDQRLGYMVGAAMYFSKKTPLERFASNLSALIRDKAVPLRKKHMSIEKVQSELSDDEPRPSVAVLSSQKDERPAVVAPVRAAPAPAVAPKGTPPSAPAPSAPPQRQRVRILVGEADHTASFSVLSLFQGAYDCVSAVSGFDAVDKARRYLPDILLINLKIPGVGLAEVVSTLRRQTEFSVTPILGLVKGSERPNWNIERVCGVSQVFLVPAELEHLAHRVRAIVNGPTFAQHRYPRPFEDIWAEEDHNRVHPRDLADLDLDREQRDMAFRQLLNKLKSE